MAKKRGKKRGYTFDFSGGRPTFRKKGSKKQEYIRKITSDGKVSKKEMRKAQKKGISAGSIQRGYDRDFRRSVKDFRPSQRRPLAQPPSYIPLTISRGASKIASVPSRQAPARGRASSSSPSAPSPATISSNIPAYTPQFDGGGGGGASAPAGPDYNLQIQSLNDQIASLTAGFQSQAQDMQQQLAQEKAVAAEQMAQMQSNFDKQMTEQQGNFRQQMAATVGTPKVEGIRFQDAGTGGATQRQLARRGVRGTFGRGGERLMKISSLNV